MIREMAKRRLEAEELCGPCQRCRLSEQRLGASSFSSETYPAGGAEGSFVTLESLYEETILQGHRMGDRPRTIRTASTSSLSPSLCDIKEECP